MKVYALLEHYHYDCGELYDIFYKEDDAIKEVEDMLIEADKVAQRDKDYAKYTDANRFVKVEGKLIWHGPSSTIYIEEKEIR